MGMSNNSILPAFPMSRPPPYYCELCDKVMSGPEPFRQHVTGERHKREVRRRGSSTLSGLFSDEPDPPRRMGPMTITTELNLMYSDLCKERRERAALETRLEALQERVGALEEKMQDVLNLVAKLARVFRRTE